MNTTLDSLKTIIKSYFTQSALGESLIPFLEINRSRLDIEISTGGESGATNDVINDIFGIRIGFGNIESIKNKCDSIIKENESSLHFSELEEKRIQDIKVDYLTIFESDWSSSGVDQLLDNSAILNSTILTAKDRMVYFSIFFIVCHEIGHILKDSGTDATSKEFKADLFAFDMLKDRLSNADKKERPVIILGAMVGLGHIMSINNSFDKEIENLSTHPFTIIRLVKLLLHIEDYVEPFYWKILRSWIEEWLNEDSKQLLKIQNSSSVNDKDFCIDVYEKMLKFDQSKKDEKESFSLLF